MIYTFYSYKGGVGRSMALANVAEILAGRGLSVLAIDFDLEAPGLERFFDGAGEFSAERALESRGIIDLIYSYKELRTLAASASVPAEALAQTESGARSAVPNLLARQRSEAGLSIERRTARLPVEPLETFRIPVYDSNSRGGSIHLVPAGRRAGAEFRAYAGKVLSFDWEDFYRRWDGELFFEWFRLEADKLADVVLLDSRTGVTEMSGVCTYHLADVVVSFVASNAQNIQGALRIGQSLANNDLAERTRAKRPLHQIFVPSRIENAESDKLKTFAANFNDTFKGLYPESFTWDQGPFSELAVPYVTAYAYGERLASRDHSDQPAAKSMIAQLNRLADLMAQLAPQDSKLHQTVLNNPESMAAAAEQSFAKLSELDRTAALQLLGRLVRVGEPGSGADDTLVRPKRSELAYPEVLDQLQKSRFIAVTKGEKAEEDVITIANPVLITHWNRLKTYLDENREFLVWRQRLAVALGAWNSTKSDDDLLSGTQLHEAKRWGIREDELTDDERGFVHQSVAKSAARATSAARTGTLRHFRWSIAAATLLLLVLAGVAIVLPNFGMSADLSWPQRYLVALHAWPQPATVVRDFNFAYNGDWANRESWLAPSTWLGAPALNGYPAVSVRGRGIGIPRNSGYFYDYVASFRLQVVDGSKAAWALRVSPDRTRGYVFQLQETSDGVNLTGAAVSGGDSQPLTLSNNAPTLAFTCGAHAVYSVRVEAHGYEFTHEITCVAAGFTSAASRVIRLTDSSRKFRFGSVGFTAADEKSATLFGFLRIEPGANILKAGGGAV